MPQFRSAELPPGLAIESVSTVVVSGDGARDGPAQVPVETQWRLALLKARREGSHLTFVPESIDLNQHPAFSLPMNVEQWAGSSGGAPVYPGRFDLLELTGSGIHKEGFPGSAGFHHRDDPVVGAVKTADHSFLEEGVMLHKVEEQLAKLPLVERVTFQDGADFGVHGVPGMTHPGAEPPAQRVPSFQSPFPIDVRPAHSLFLRQEVRRGETEARAAFGAAAAALAFGDDTGKVGSH